MTSVEQAAHGAPRPTEVGERPAPVSIRALNSEFFWRVLRHIVFAILLVRSICDPIFSLTGGGLEGSSMGIGAVVNAAAVAIACGLVLRRPATSPAAVYGVWAPFLLITIVSVFYAPQFTAGARLAFGFLTYWAFFAIPFFIFRSDADLSRFVLLVVASSIAPSLYGFFDLRNGLSDLAEFRLQSTFSHPNIFAFYLVLQIGLALYLRSSAAVKVSPRLRMVLTLYIPVLVILLALTKTRGAWLAGALMFLVYSIRIERRFLLGILLIPLLLAFDSSLVDRFTDVTEETEIESYSQLNENNRLNSYAWRQALWESAIPAIADRPVLGHGLETFRSSVPSFFAPAGPEGIDAHNMYLQISYEMGLAGAFALAWVFAAVARRLISGLRYDRTGVLVMLCVLGAYVLESYADNMQFYLAFNWYFWFIMGTICVWIERKRRASAEQGSAHWPRQTSPSDPGTALQVPRLAKSGPVWRERT